METTRGIMQGYLMWTNIPAPAALGRQVHCHVALEDTLVFELV